MEKIILGYLMICGMSAYDLKTSIRKNMSSMCSASAGSIYTALKKLLEQGLIAEAASGPLARDKKIYAITEKGRDAFLCWIDEPMKTDKAKDIELAKMFFAGMQGKEAQIASVAKYIETLEAELDGLLQIETATNAMCEEDLLGMRERLSADPNNAAGIKALGNDTVTREMVMRIYKEQMRTLSYGIAQTRFQIGWYKSMLAELENE
ncbi:MAG: helix-turn-helix transcriptional regulator [Clostridia bacterium]|nr:helix-turn-helix transcriptional regulator [Clostridia bacterium]